MKESFKDENYLKKRKKEGRDIYSQCSRLGDILDAPMCVDYTNELLVQVKDVMPETFENLRKDYRRKRLYPLYIQAHHTHVSLLRAEEMTQEIVWNMQYLHQVLGVPYPRYKGLFPTEGSLSYARLEAVEAANIDYVVFPHLNEKKVSFSIEGEGDYIYRPFWLKGRRRSILALPRNFPISQEIWRPITRMKRDEVKSQGYILGEYPVFDSEYLTSIPESYPISGEEGTKIYKEVLCRELEKVPEGGLLLYIQDLELMDFGDIALEIIEKAWKEILETSKNKYRIHFVTPDAYIDGVLSNYGLEKLPVLHFDKISWAPEIRVVLRADGHYPPLGVSGVGPYDVKRTGIYERPHIFWENGKYYCGVFDNLLDMFGITVNVPADVGRLGETEYELNSESPDTRAVLYHRLMKRACNWGWRPTEGRQKRPCLLGYLLCSLLLQKLEEHPLAMVLMRRTGKMDHRLFVGLCETLEVFIENRVNYLKYGIEEYKREKGLDLSGVKTVFDSVEEWKNKAKDRAKALFELNQSGLPDISRFLILMQEYSQAVYMATDHIQRIWSMVPDGEYLVNRMYHYLYKLYPPLFPAMLERIDGMNESEAENYFRGVTVKALIR
ncbi:MAG: glycoside hydrolase [Peptococcaceae bacterium]|nr:glycoside hydrolase [Peptococcaceae bacterium]MDH7525221.1 glycoside hydrolase [Peptococcaceae bacterium]